MPPQSASRRASQNSVIAALDDPKSREFLSALESVTLAQGQTIYDPSAAIEHAYFPETAVLSMLAITDDGQTVEVGPVGDEGMAGLRVFLGAADSPERVIVHVAGTALRVRTDALRQELDRAGSVLPRLLLRYTQMLLAMSWRTAVCYKLHSLEQQLTRWLLMMHDYAGGDELALTHELMALTLGVRRAGVSEAAAKLKAAGIIAYRRGRIRIVNREELSAFTCECHAAIKDEYDRLYADLSGGATSRFGRSYCEGDSS